MARGSDILRDVDAIADGCLDIRGLNPRTYSGQLRYLAGLLQHKHRRNAAVALNRLLALQTRLAARNAYSNAASPESADVYDSLCKHLDGLEQFLHPTADAAADVAPQPESGDNVPDPKIDPEGYNRYYHTHYGRHADPDYDKRMAEVAELHRQLRRKS